MEVMSNTANQIFFNLIGPDGKRLDVWRAISEVARRDPRASVTSWELYQIYLHPEWWERVTWMAENGVARNPFVTQ
jgi:hypothetical protein